MKRIALFLLLCMVVTLTGCPKKLYSTRPSTKLGQDKLMLQVNEYLGDRQRVYYCAVNGGTVNYEVDDKLFAIKYSCKVNDGGAVPADEKNKEIAKRIRNEVLENGVTAIDSLYNNFIDDLNTGRSTTNFIADVIDLGLGAAVGITKGERPLQILGVALTAFRGGRKSIDINFFREQTVPILVNKMDDNRAKVYSEIIQKRDRSVDDYMMEEAIRDIVRYFNAGTLIRAFGELSKDTAAKALQSEDQIKVLKGLQPSTVSTKEDRDTSVSAFGVLNKLAKESATAAATSTKTDALSKLQKIAETIQNNKSITDELNKDTTLKSLLGDLKKNVNDGVKLANILNDLRFEADGKVKIDTLNAIDKIINENGGTRGGK